MVVVTIFVNPSGKVEDAFIGPGTTTGNESLRESARKAALATRFNAVDETNTQTGTITYRFQLN